MNTSLASVDNSQIWVPLDTLQSLAGMPGQATIVTLAKGLRTTPTVEGWKLRTPAYLLSDLRQVVQSKTIGQTIMFTILSCSRWLAIFDTQVLSIFRRGERSGCSSLWG